MGATELDVSRFVSCIFDFEQPPQIGIESITVLGIDLQWLGSPSDSQVDFITPPVRQVDRNRSSSGEQEAAHDTLLCQKQSDSNQNQTENPSKPVHPATCHLNDIIEFNTEVLFLHALDYQGISPQLDAITATQPPR